MVVGDFDSLPAPDGDWEIVDAGPHEQQDNSDAEKAVLLANILRVGRPQEAMTIEVAPDRATLHAGGRSWTFGSRKHLRPQVWTVPTEC